ncbi:hypothetical protein TBLA_0B07770 [Henningerozyma blattae CBS 6284]|uniref:Nucleosome assembly protein n=1 Tax=Henningerozyma blattae (strain ATCC 34711 / CBS 6284 / DSM 70876 / NBRC 10599 / NRRL Y-10934 / UCD 77-7) TaxID=1071380 RepID=I2GZP1_HENB6|nr:hypothetical protein TBLA_0B07770 [Tetrapisispora blattae CBS 6284]CCH59593.1 hypothetical protein TBLA_0B07770 [Tetrapisispora blattae CBS 6284]
MTEPIKAKPKSSMKIDNAPTPHNTPASVAGSSFLKNGNPLGEAEKREMPVTIDEESKDENGEINSKVMSDQPLFLQSIQDKLDNLIGSNSGYVKTLPVEIKNRIFALKKIQSDLFDMEKEFQIEMFALEEKFLKKYQPLYDYRNEIVNGKSEPSKEEVELGKKLDAEDAENEGLTGADEEDEVNGDVKGVPSFWLTSLDNLPIVTDTITERDSDVLNYLQDIKLEYLNNGEPGFKLIFEFDSSNNEYFKNKELVKTYYYQRELGYSGDFIYDHAEGSKIDWVDNNKNVTVEVEMRKQRNKTTKQVRTIEKITPVESFFNFFDPPKVKSPVLNDEGNEEEDEDEEDDLEQRLALDYSIGEQIKDKLIPRAVDWFTGTALEYEYDNEYEEGEEEYDEEYEEGEGSEDEEGDDMAGAEAPECKQS